HNQPSSQMSNVRVWHAAPGRSYPPGRRMSKTGARPRLALDLIALGGLGMFQRGFAGSDLRRDESERGRGDEHERSDDRSRQRHLNADTIQSIHRERHDDLLEFSYNRSATRLER